MMQNPVCEEETPPLVSTLPQQQWPRPHQLSALVAKYTGQDGIELDDACFAGN